jgi:hypothetical protein
VTKTKTTTKTTFAGIFLLAVAVFMPACDVFNPQPCDPNEQICPVTGGHPDTLAPRG